jgi:hypothetical protein
MNSERSNKALLAEAIAMEKIDDAEKYFSLVLAEYGSSPIPIMIRYDEARILLLKNQRERAIMLLEEMRTIDQSLLTLILSIKILCEYKVNRKLARSLFKKLKGSLRSFVPVDDDDLPKSYYDAQAAELELEIRRWLR